MKTKLIIAGLTLLSLAHSKSYADHHHEGWQKITTIPFWLLDGGLQLDGNQVQSKQWQKTGYAKLDADTLIAISCASVSSKNGSCYLKKEEIKLSQAASPTMEDFLKLLEQNFNHSFNLSFNHKFNHDFVLTYKLNLESSHFFFGSLKKLAIKNSGFPVDLMPIIKPHSHSRNSDFPLLSPSNSKTLAKLLKAGPSFYHLSCTQYVSFTRAPPKDTTCSIGPVDPPKDPIKALSVFDLVQDKLVELASGLK